MSSVYEGGSFFSQAYFMTPAQVAEANQRGGAVVLSPNKLAVLVKIPNELIGIPDSKRNISSPPNDRQADFMTTHEAFMADILAHPEDDTVRLIFADWLDEQGEVERAEFIRVQCKLAGLGECARDFSAGLSCCCRFCTSGGLMMSRRERELFAGPRWWDYLPGSYRATVANNISIEAAEGITYFVRRGFVAEITCTADDWLQHADVLTEVQPIEAVTLTTWPKFVRYEDDSGEGMYYFAMRVQWIPPPYISSGDGHEIERRLLALTWPRIKFTLPR